jgi:hypothetical protein
VRICKALLEEDEEWDEGEARRLTEEAWQEDSRGTGALTRTVFNDSLFEVGAPVLSRGSSASRRAMRAARTQRQQLR